MDEMEYESNKVSGFKKGYLIFIAVLVVIVIGVWAFVWIKLSDYQKDVDSSSEEISVGTGELSAEEKFALQNKAQECFSRYLDQMSDSDWISAYRASNPDSIDSDEEILSLLREKVFPFKSGKFRAFDYTDDNPSFLLGTKDNAVAAFSLSKNGEDYSVNEVKVFERGEGAVTFTAYSGGVISINGIVLEGYQVSEEEVTVEGYENDLINPVKISTYAVDGIINPDVEIQVENSFKTFDDFYYKAIDDNNGLVAKSEDFVRALLRYYSQGKSNLKGNMGAVLALVDSSSEAAKVIRNTESGLEWVPPSDIPLDVECSDVCELADNCRFTEVNCASGNIYRVYFIDNGNGYKIMQFSCVQ